MNIIVLFAEADGSAMVTFSVFVPTTWTKTSNDARLWLFPSQTMSKDTAIVVSASLQTNLCLIDTYLVISLESLNADDETIVMLENYVGVEDRLCHNSSP